MVGLSAAAAKLKQRSELLQVRQTAEVLNSETRPTPMIVLFFQEAKLAQEEAKLIAKPSPALQQQIAEENAAGKVSTS